MRGQAVHVHCVNNKGKSLPKEMLREADKYSKLKGNPIDKVKGRNNSGQSINKYWERE